MKVALSFLAGLLVGVAATIGFAVYLDQSRDQGSLQPAQSVPSVRQEANNETVWRFSNRQSATSNVVRLELSPFDVQPTTKQRPLLSIACQNGVLQTILDADEVLDQTQRTTKARYSLDSGSPAEDTFSLVTANAFEINSVQLINLLRNGKTFTISYTNFDNVLIDASFNVSGLDQYLPALFEACPN